MIELIKLPYAYDALEPVLDKETMEIHHSKHHNTYVTNVKNAITGTEHEGKSLEELLTSIDSLDASIQTVIRNNAGGVHNHNLFFTSLTPGGSKLPSGALATAIDAKFGSLENLVEELKKGGVSRFGSGWSWLVVNNGELEVMTTPNQDSPIMEGKTPIFGIDVWEHAYYLKFQNRRPDYLTAIFDVVCWETVAKRFEEAN
ncbi:MAG: superoxide dismutase [Mycoplasmatales bacterium]